MNFYWHQQARGWLILSVPKTDFMTKMTLKVTKASKATFIILFFQVLVIKFQICRVACGTWHDKIIIITMPCICYQLVISCVRCPPGVINAMSCDSVIQSNSKPMNNSEYTQLSCKRKKTLTAHQIPYQSFSNVENQVSCCKFNLIMITM